MCRAGCAKRIICLCIGIACGYLDLALTKLFLAITTNTDLQEASMPTLHKVAAVTSKGQIILPKAIRQGSSRDAGVLHIVSVLRNTKILKLLISFASKKKPRSHPARVIGSYLSGPGRLH